MSSKESKSKKKSGPPVWTRIVTGEEGETTLSREVDEAQVQQLLRERWEAKQSKDFELADQHAAALKMMRIGYHDEKKTWQTLPLSSVRRADIIDAAPQRKRSKKQERNRRQAEKNKRKQAGGSVSDGSGSGGEERPEPVAERKRVRTS